MIEAMVIDTWIDQLILRVQVEYESDDFKQKVNFAFETTIQENTDEFIKRIWGEIEDKRKEYEDLLNKQDHITEFLKENSALKIK